MTTAPAEAALPGAAAPAEARPDKGLPLRILKPVMELAADAGCEFQDFTAR